ncbi:hypothetical protein CPB83DRAFT_900330 [Crepidotus variabilis]|uniref:Uncharacterized protein n=1 Tax=Crepidotus variabilis TaxID=179855 RepID=A0A9P6E3B6_9AGAR|nr:hypothetical protein CPB83DRAFT_900330 [Crepidotus variabilis]
MNSSLSGTETLNSEAVPLHHAIASLSTNAPAIEARPANIRNRWMNRNFLPYERWGMPLETDNFVPPGKETPLGVTLDKMVRYPYSGAVVTVVFDTKLDTSFQDNILCTLEKNLWFANPDQPQYFDNIEKGVIKLEDADPKKFTRGDIVWVSFRLSPFAFRLGIFVGVGWQTETIPLEFIRVGRIPETFYDVAAWQKNPEYSYRKPDGHDESTSALKRKSSNLELDIKHQFPLVVFSFCPSQ